MGNQFFYTYKDEKENDAIGSFNVNKVIRSYSTSEGGRVVLLDDIHEEYHVVDTGTNPQKPRLERRKIEVCSQVFLNAEDSERFRKITEIVPLRGGSVWIGDKAKTSKESE